MSSVEKVANVNSEFSLSENKPSSISDDVRFKRMMGFNRQGVDAGRPFDGGGGRGVGGGSGGGGGGPKNCNSGGATEAVGHMYGAGVSSFRFGGENLATSTTNLQPFDIFADAYSTTLYKSPEEMAAASAAFPFTFAQWKELERQAMIYKYMTSSVPVPPDLLFPHSRNYSVAALHSPASLYNARYSRNGDPEPGRCKRTDGKKWRCSRDVAPHQKYCERHLHRGRPRSRKPVEVKNNGETLKKTRIEQSHVPYPTASSQHFTAGNDKPLLLFNAKNDLSVSASSSYREPKRGINFMTEGTDQQWQHLVESNMGFANVGSSVYGSNSLFHQDYVEQQPLNVLSYSNFPTPETDPLPSGFIDAWSSNNLDCCNSENAESSSITMNHDNLSPSLNLSIAMAAGSIADQEMGTLECCNEQIGKDSRWISPAFWEPFARGGPLAEALQLGSLPILGCKNPAPPRDSMSAPATTVSSPTGVLHRTLFPHSDGSVCNSPNPAGSTSEIAFRHLN